jgi:hypothetical protein
MKAHCQWYRRNIESISLLDGLLIIVAVIAVVVIILYNLARRFGVTFNLTGALFYLFIDGAVGLLFFLSSRAVTVYVRYLVRGVPAFFVSLAITVVFLTAAHLACSYLLSHYPEFVPDFRIIAVVDVVIPGGFLSGLAHRANASVHRL